jgi:protocatechuate 3,4-dioxygenase beta subunit
MKDSDKDSDKDLDQEIKIIDRRSLIAKMFTATTATLVGSRAIAQSVCGITPEQTEGPFYPIADQADKNTDLTKVKGRAVSARGQVCFVGGVVQDEFCKPIKGALVEIWQACDSGKYNHPSDPNPARLDPNFQYWGQAITDKDGRYSFKTIIPGAYPATSNWMRPPHIHFKVHLRGFEELTTQMYWKGHPLNKGDRILQAMPQRQRELVEVEFKNENGILSGDFPLTLKAL